MATGTADTVLLHLRRAALLPDGAGLTDGQLLECFLSRHEEAAFEALVRRHGPMVLGVCRRVLQHAHDADDAFQATFLVLVRKAASIVPPERVASWLHGVAYRTAVAARTAAAKRRAKERQVRNMPRSEPPPHQLWVDLRSLLDQELNRLPDRYRLPIVLCDLEERPRKEAARQLGLPEGTLSSRLATARQMLARRLTRRGLTVTVGALVVALSQNGVSACVRAALAASTVKAATLFAAGNAAGTTSAQVAALAERVVNATLMARLKIAPALLLVAGAIGLSVGVIASRTPAADPVPDTHTHLEAKEEPPASLPERVAPEVFDQTVDAGRQQRQEPQTGQNPKADGQKIKADDDDDDDDVKSEGVLRAVDLSRNTVSVTVKRDGKYVDQTFGLTRDVTVALDGGAADIAGLETGMRVSLKLSRDGKKVVGIKELKKSPKGKEEKNKKDGRKTADD